MLENRDTSGSLKQKISISTVAYDDVLMEILARLPVKCVIRSKLVCKSWLSLISTDEFRRLHTLRRHKPPPSLILATSCSWHQFVTRELFYSPNMNEISEEQSGEQSEEQSGEQSEEQSGKQRIVPLGTKMINNFEMLSCSNGLMLLQSKHDNNIHVYNPTTKQSKKLSLARNSKIVQVMSLHLVFDPCQSPHYKIVCIRGNFTHHQIEVFDSESGKWRVCVEPFSTHGFLLNLASGCVPFESLIYLIYDRHPLSGRIYCFDVVKNVSRFIVCPVPRLAIAEAAEVAEAAEAVPKYSHMLQESNGCLYYCALFSPNLAAVWELHVGEDDPRQSTWLLKYKQVVGCAEHMKENKVLRFIAETSTVLIHVSGKVVAYNFLDESCTEVHGLEFDIPSVNIHQFGETLAVL